MSDTKQTNYDALSKQSKQLTHMIILGHNGSNYNWFPCKIRQSLFRSIEISITKITRVMKLWTIQFTCFHRKWINTDIMRHSIDAMHHKIALKLHSQIILIKSFAQTVLNATMDKANIKRIFYNFFHYRLTLPNSIVYRSDLYVPDLYF